MSRWLSSFRLVGSRVRILSALSFGPGNRLADEVLLFLDGQNAVAICGGWGARAADELYRAGALPVSDGFASLSGVLGGMDP